MNWDRPWCTLLYDTHKLLLLIVGGHLFKKGSDEQSCMFIWEKNHPIIRLWSCGIMVRIDPCHGSDPGSIPGSFVFSFFLCRSPWLQSVSSSHYLPPTWDIISSAKKQEKTHTDSRPHHALPLITRQVLCRP